MNKLKQESQNNSIPHIPFYFARHGKTDWNKENRVMGQVDIPLNEIGLAQANTIAEKLANLGISHIFSGPLKRTGPQINQYQEAHQHRLLTPSQFYEVMVNEALKSHMS